MQPIKSAQNACSSTYFRQRNGAGGSCRWQGQRRITVTPTLRSVLACQSTSVHCFWLNILSVHTADTKRTPPALHALIEDIQGQLSRIVVSCHFCPSGSVRGGISGSCRSHASALARDLYFGRNSGSYNHADCLWPLLTNSKRSIVGLHCILPPGSSFAAVQCPTWPIIASLTCLWIH